jgi:hypothetical protein
MVDTDFACRRSAIVAFLAAAEGEHEVPEFVQLMLRPFLMDLTQPSSAPANLNPVHASEAQRMGFLHLLRSVIRQLGFHVLRFVPQFADVVLSILGEANQGDGAAENLGADAQEAQDEEASDDEEEEEPEEAAVDLEGNQITDMETDEDSIAQQRGRKKRDSALRLVGLQALSDMMEQYHDAVDFQPFKEKLWAIMGGSCSHHYTLHSTWSS